MAESPSRSQPAISFRRLAEAEYPWDLLLEADPSRAMVAGYLDGGICIGAFLDAGGADPLGEYVLAFPSEDEAEIANIAVDAAWRGRGIGRRLVAHAALSAGARGAARLWVGTGNSSIGQLAFYQRCGFRIDCVDRDFFTRKYPEPIFENGIRCRDMVRLSLEL